MMPFTALPFGLAPPRCLDESNIACHYDDVMLLRHGVILPSCAQTELTPELVHEFIEKIVVSEARYLDGRRIQIFDIYYSGVGVIKVFSPEEEEEAFERGMERRRKARTA